MILKKISSVLQLQRIEFICPNYLAINTFCVILLFIIKTLAKDLEAVAVLSVKQFYYHDIKYTLKSVEEKSVLYVGKFQIKRRS